MSRSVSGAITLLLDPQMDPKDIELIGCCFSKNGRELIVSSNEAGVFEIWSIKVTTGNKRRLSNRASGSLFVHSASPRSGCIALHVNTSLGHTRPAILKRNGRVKLLWPGYDDQVFLHSWS